MKFVVCALAAALVVSTAAAQQPPCWHDAFAALSFLEGEWTVRVEQRLGNGTWEATSARSWITPQFEGCALVENCVGEREGKPFVKRATHAYNAVADRLQSVWIDSGHGMLVTYEGAATGSEILLDYAMTLRGDPVVLRIAYASIAADSFYVEHRRSNDGGGTWDVTARQRYVRAPRAEVPAPQPSVDLPAPLARVLTDYERAWAAQDAAALAALFVEDGFVLPNGGPPIRGRDAIARHYAGAGGPLALRALAFGVDGATGYIIGGFTHTHGASDIGKFTLTLRRDGDGRWLIVSDMDSPNRRT